MDHKEESIMKMSFVLAVLLLFGALGCVSCSSNPEESVPAGRLVIFHTGSLSVPFAAVEKEFEARHPQIYLVLEAGGSTEMVRMISEKGKAADILASADFSVIDKNLIPDQASCNIRFAGNQLVLCYTDKSKFADEVNAGNWYEILQRPEVVWGHSDPELGPAGYRSLMVLQLAEKFHDKPGLYQQLLANRPLENVRTRAEELISLLQGGKMDYAWEYRSIAVQNGLRFVTLDDHINLGNYHMDDYYGQAVVQVTGAEPGTTIERKGQAITYGVTLIDAAPNKAAAEAFLAYLFDAEGGQRILAEQGQPPFPKAWVPNREMKDRLPASLQKLVTVRN
jgi:molybdate/tungstate transport system substrate-binding protein